MPRRFLIPVAALAALAVLGVAACGPSSGDPSTGQAPAATSPAAATSSAAATFSYSVSCRMGKGPYDDYVNGPSWVPWVTVANTGSESFTLPDLQVNDSPLSFQVEFFDSSGSQVAEDDGYGGLNMSGVVTVQPGHSYTIPNPQVNGTVGDDYPGDPTCTAAVDGGL